MISGLFSDYWVSRSLERAMGAALHVPVVLLCSAYRGAFSCSWPSTPFFFIVLFIIYPVGLSCTGAAAGAGFFSSTELMSGLQVGQALNRCSSNLGLGSAVLVSMFLGAQPPYTTMPLIIK